MKRCPQCEFIYEDDQSLCDMDGVLLVLDSRTLPNHQTLATGPRKPPKRNRAVPAFATLILALVLGMVYYVSTRRPTISPSPAMTTAAVPEPAINPTPEAQPSEVPKEEEKPAVTNEPTAAPGKKPAAKAAPSPQPKASTRAKKDNSKVGSIIKKTGRILKKPFKF